MARPQPLVDAQVEQALALCILARRQLLQLQEIGIAPQTALQITIESAFIAGIGLYRSACIEMGIEPDLARITEIFASLLDSPLRFFDEAGVEILKQ